MKILHTSDMHGEVMKVLHNKPHILSEFDVWIETGDFFTNDPIMGTIFDTWVRKIDKKHEVEFQKKWLKYNNICARITEWLNGRPFISVSGNHDFISLADELKNFGCPNVHEIKPEGFELLGYKWAGFPNVNYMCGEWNHESFPIEFDALVEQIHITQPDILVLHSPIRGILDIGGYYKKNIGIGHLTNYLSYRPNRIRNIFHGHVHEKGGKKHLIRELNILIYNGARHAILHEI